MGTENRLEHDNKVVDVITSIQQSQTPIHEAKQQASEPEYGDHWLPEAIQSLHISAGYPRLFKHQSYSASMGCRNYDVVTATGTASGKTLGFALPLAHQLTKKPFRAKKKAIILLPQNALANDQLQGLTRLFKSADPRSASDDSTKQQLQRIQKLCVRTIEGSTPQKSDRPGENTETREDILRKADVIMTNPDLLHMWLLPHYHSKPVFKNLAAIVVDELHEYLGVFGSQVSLVLRRLMRLGVEKPACYAASATLSSPGKHMEALFGLEQNSVCASTESGAAKSEKHVLFVQPRQREQSSGGRKGEDGDNTVSSHTAISEICQTLAEHRMKFLCFVKSRRECEELSKNLNRALNHKRKDHWASQSPFNVKPYRAGLTSKQRRDIEEGIKRGAVDAIVSTRALELGVDIGQLDATIHVGVSKTCGAFLQQSGRAGRRDRSSLAVIVADDISPLDAYYVPRAKQLFEREPEDVVMNPSNAHIVCQHLPVAAKEKVISVQRDGPLFGGQEELRSLVDELCQEAKLQRAGDEVRHRQASSEISRFMIRGLNTGEAIQLKMDAKALEPPIEIERHRAHAEVHQGAVYMHHGRSFRVTSLDMVNSIAHVVDNESKEGRESEVSTIAIVDTLVEERKQRERGHMKMAHRWIGEVQVRGEVSRYWKVNKGKREEAPVHIDETAEAPELNTVAVRFSLSQAASEHVSQQVQSVAERAVDESKQIGEVQTSEAASERERQSFKASNEIRSAAGHLACALAPALAICDENDISCALGEMKDNDMRLYLYDTNGGMGLCEHIYEKAELLWRQALATIEECACDGGCVKCTGRSGLHLSVDVKAMTKRLLRTMLAEGREGGRCPKQGREDATQANGEEQEPSCKAEGT